VGLYCSPLEVGMGGFAVVFGTLAVACSAAAAEQKLSFHLVLCDGHGQLQGQSKRVAGNVVEIFRDIGIDVTWSSDPRVPPSSAVNVVTVAVLPHSSSDWRIRDRAMATTLRAGAGSASIFLFYPDIARAMGIWPARMGSIRDRPAGIAWDVGVARVITHEILHYFLPSRPHDKTGIFMEHLRGDFLLSQKLEVVSETRGALLEKLRSLQRL
jgi:hypothetical protein